MAQCSMIETSSRKKCPHCNQTYADAKGHVNNAHKDVESQNGNMKCTACNASFSHINTLVGHMNEEHKLRMDKSDHSFINYSEFLMWKEEEEKRKRAHFIQHCGSVVRSGTRHYYFYCNRSGFFQNKGTGIRSTKIKGTSKLGATCTAHMKVKEDLDTKMCKLEYCQSHCGHKGELAHLPLSKDFKVEVAAKLQQGVSVDKIMDDIREDFDDENSITTREVLASKQDIHNIRRMLNLGNIRKHSNDQTSVDIWVKEMVDEEYNPVLVFKPQGVPNTAETDNLSTENFLLAIQTKFQRDMMKKYGNNVICIDSTHGTNSYDFLLVTVMVVDNYGEGLPVAWAITDKEDACTIVQFFQPLFERVGTLRPDIFMSDDAEQFYNAWCGVFGPGPRKLLCSWHVDRAWRKAIREHVTGPEVKIEAYHILRVLLWSAVRRYSG